EPFGRPPIGLWPRLKLVELLAIRSPYPYGAIFYRVVVEEQWLAPLMTAAQPRGELVERRIDGVLAPSPSISFASLERPGKIANGRCVSINRQSIVRASVCRMRGGTTRVKRGQAGATVGASCPELVFGAE